MSAMWGNKIKFTIFGESHGNAIGGVLDGIKAGTKIDFDKIDFELKRRNHRAFYSTARDEKDAYEVLSGVKDNVATGAPIGFMIKNKDQHSGDYVNLNLTPRPGHADYPASVKFGGFNENRGGGHFSGRITAPLTFAGSVARQIMEDKGVKIVSHIYSIGSVQSQSILETPLNEEEIERLHNMEFPVLCEETKKQMEEEITKYKTDCNSVGGIIECAVYGMNAGVGSPFFSSVESEIARMNGFDANDNYEIKDSKVAALTNNNGGILGGLTNGMPIVFRVAIKPTPSIFKTQKTVDVDKMTNEEITLKGRHDACIVPRACAVIEAACALCLLDLTESE